MKKRLGFVSNSSSSSFIIESFQKIKTLKDANELIPDHIGSFLGFPNWGTKSKVSRKYTRKEVAKDLLERFKDKKTLTLEQVLEEYPDFEVQNYYKNNFVLFYETSQGDDDAIGSDYEHRILPAVAVYCESHH